MKTKNLTPFPVGAKLTSRRPSELEMTLVVRGAFRLAPGEPVAPLVGKSPLLAQGTMSAELYRDDDLELRGEAIYGGDFADYKLNAEVLLKGTCHVPGGEPRDECPVKLGVGGWSKLLRVVGPRAWSDGYSGAVMSAPLPFSRMALDHAHAFGGPGFAANPVGKGVGNDELPTVEYAREPVRARSDRPRPASFGPISPTWPERAGKMGKEYGKAYREKRAPFYAEDFDWTFFQSAPADQQLPGYLRGDEELLLQNLHPKEPVFTTRLPGLRVRAFVNDVYGRFREVWMNLDTLCLEPDEGRLLLTWRGLDRVREDDLTDVKTVLVASEKLGDAPLPEAHYQGLLAAYEADPLEIKAHAPARSLELFQMLKDGPGPEVAPEPGADPLAAKLKSSLRFLEPEQRAEVERGLAESATTMRAAEPHADVSGPLAKALNDVPKDSPPAAAPVKPGGAQGVPIAARVKEAKAQLAAARVTAEAQGADTRELAQLEALLDDPRLGQLDPALRADAKPPVEPGPGRDCSGQDFTGRDLRGRDLRGINLEGAILTRANLADAKLAGARLKQAVFLQADLTGADLSDADLTEANLTEVRASGADLRRVTLDRCFGRRAVFAGATLTGAHGTLVLFQSPDLTQVKARNVRFVKLLLRDALLEQADLSEAELVRCHFLGAQARGLVLRAALLDRTSFAGSDLTGASLIDAHGEGSIWSRATLTDADFGWAVLPSAYFGEAKALRTRFHGANLKGSRFYRASLEHADFTRANLFSADLSKALVSFATFRDANLYDAKLLKTAGSGCDFQGANLKRSTLEWA